MSNVVTTHVHAVYNSFRATVFLRRGMCTHARSYMYVNFVWDINQSEIKDYEFLLQMTLDQGIMAGLVKIVVLSLDL